MEAHVDGDSDISILTGWRIKRSKNKRTEKDLRNKSNAVAKREERKRNAEISALRSVIFPLNSQPEVHLAIFIQANSIKCILQRVLASDFSLFSLSVLVQVPITTHLDFVKAFYLLSTPPVSSLSSILPSEILSFKGYFIPWRTTTEFWAWVTILHDLDLAKTCSLRWTTSHSLIFQPHWTTGHCPHMTFPLSASVLLIFWKQRRCLHLPYLLNSYASCKVQLGNCPSVYILITLYLNYPLYCNCNLLIPVIISYLSFSFRLSKLWELCVSLYRFSVLVSGT